MSDFKNLIRTTEYQVLGKLPDPFLTEKGKRIRSVSEWPEQRKMLFRSAVELQYGTQPPAPEVFEVVPCYLTEKQHTYRIIAGTAEKQLSFYMKLFTPGKTGPWPTAVDGDLCFKYVFDNPWHEAFTDNGFALAMFDRTELAHDIYGEDRSQSPLYEIYPEYTFGALGAWAWGYQRVTDALLKLGLLDTDCLAYTGHSRGGKTAMLAGVLDERATIVAPNETNAGSCGCYRIHMRAIQENGLEGRSETLKDLCTAFPFWLGPEMAAYQDREQELPFDCHFLKALVAPRILLVGEAASDIWTNPIGSWQTTMAAKEVFDFLGAGGNLYWYYRRGYHFHALEDVMHLVELMRRETKGIRTPLNNRFFETPFEEPELIFDWKAPGKK